MLAAKGASAAAIAWVIRLLAPAPFSEYPYYAPLGAVVTMSSTAVSSVRVSAQAVGAVLIGAAIARVADTVLAINMLLPPLPLTPSRLALDRLCDVLVDQVEVLAERLEQEGPLDAGEWEDQRREVTSTIVRGRWSHRRARRRGSTGERGVTVSGRPHRCNVRTRSQQPPRWSTTS